MGRACPAGVRALIEACWARDPKQRPTFEEVIQRLDHCTAECGQ